MSGGSIRGRPGVCGSSSGSRGVARPLALSQTLQERSEPAHPRSDSIGSSCRPIEDLGNGRVSISEVSSIVATVSSDDVTLTWPGSRRGPIPIPTGSCKPTESSTPLRPGPVEGKRSSTGARERRARLVRISTPPCSRRAAEAGIRRVRAGRARNLTEPARRARPDDTVTRPTPGADPPALAATLRRMANDSPPRLRVLIADGRKQRVDHVADIVAGLGHDVVARDTALSDVAEHTSTERPDVALVILGDSSERALDQIRLIVKKAACPCIAILDVSDSAFVNEAAKLGIFAHVSTQDVADLQSSIDIVLRRFAEYHNLEGAFARRAITERAKGVLMERHRVDEGTAFEMLRDHSRRTNRKIVDVAEALVASLSLLPNTPTAEDGDRDPLGPGEL